MKTIDSQSLAANYAFSLTLAGIGVSFFVVFFMLGLQGNLFSNSSSPFTSDNELKKFSSYNEMSDFLSRVNEYFAKLYSNAELAPGYGPLGGVFNGFVVTEERAPSLGGDLNTAQQLSSLDVVSDYSGTNVQVSGVDEADFLKNDGKYAYIISGDKLTIVDAFPPEDAKVESRVTLDIAQGQNLQNMFLNGDRVVVFYQDYGQQNPSPTTENDRVYGPRTHILIIDVSDRTSPKILKNYDVTGEYSNSRMIGSRIFVLTLTAVDYQNPVKPSVLDSSSSSLIASPDVYYFDYPQQNYAFNIVTMLNLDDIGTGSEDQKPSPETGLVSKTFMIGAGSAVYVSDKNLYIAYQEQREPLPGIQQNAVEEFLSTVTTRDLQRTIIHKISIESGSLFDYVGKAEVPGRLLNQFSMDEHGDRFTVATTSDHSSPRGFFTQNNVYTLDGKMAIVAKLEGIAEGESIFAARFMGDRLYLVTFRVIDPFFVIDLSRDQPQVLGELKLPGFSNYLHPYDDSHIIGIGREGTEAGNQGVKVALFDVSDVSHPEALDTYTIGDSQTDSEVLRDHKAVLFDKDRDILSIPVSSYDGYYSDNAGIDDPLYRGSGPWNGFYVFGIDLRDGFKLKGTIQHNEGSDGSIDMSQGSRAFFIKDALYTVTPGLMEMNDLNDLEKEINSIPLNGLEGGQLARTE